MHAGYIFHKSVPNSSKSKIKWSLNYPDTNYQPDTELIVLLGYFVK